MILRIMPILLMMSCIDNEPSFLDKVLMDFDTNGLFIVFTVETAEYNGEVIVPNEGLYYYYQEMLNLSKEEYFVEMKKKFQGKESLIVLDTLKLETWDFEKVENIESMAPVAQKGKYHFINTYFDNSRVIKDGITDQERRAIVVQLFKWEVGSYIDDETGYLVIED